MRIFAIILISAVVGTALGGGLALVEFRMGGDVVMPRPGEPAIAPSVPDEPMPRIEIVEPEFQFGAMQRGTKKTHPFIVKNVGTAPLTLRVGQTTCKCTLGVASDEPIPPGGSAAVRLEWTANADVPGPFRQGATLITNDPSRSSMLLSVVGEVTEAQGVEPPDFIFDKVSAGASRSAEVFVMAMFQDDITVSDPRLDKEETREFFDVRVEPVGREQLPDQEARAGVRVTVTAKPGLPLGSFNQRLTLHTSLPDAQELTIPIIGRVVGDISIHGIEWDDERATLRLGHVQSSEGKVARLNVVIRGAGAEAVKFNVVSCDPPELKVTIGEPRKLRETLVHVPLEIEVPAGTPPMIRLGTVQGDEGQITLGSTHPIVRELVLGVRFSVER